MKKLFVVFLFLTLNISLASNTILAIVNNEVITTESFQNQLNIASTFDQKMDLLSQQIDISLQIETVKKLGIEPKNEEINGALIQLAINNSISLEEIKSHPQYVLFVQQIIETLSLIKLEQFITKDFKPELSENEILQNCSIEKSASPLNISSTMGTAVSRYCLMVCSMFFRLSILSLSISWSFFRFLIKPATLASP